MLLLEILLLTCVLRVTSIMAQSIKRRRTESKWDIIHHEYHGPPAPLDKHGRVVNTPEVEQARSNHLAIHAEAVADLTKKMTEFQQKKAHTEAMKITEKSEEQQKKETLLVTAPTEEVMESLTSWASDDDEKNVLSENEIINLVNSVKPVLREKNHYEGPLAPIGDDGRVLETPEVRKAKEAHLLAYQQATELTKVNETDKTKLYTDSDLEWYETRKKIYFPFSPAHSYPGDKRMRYKGLTVPIDEHSHAVDVPAVQRIKRKHRKTRVHSPRLSKNYRLTSENNTI